MGESFFGFNGWIDRGDGRGWASGGEFLGFLFSFGFVLFVTPRDPAWENDSRRAPIYQEAYTRARLKKAGINQHSGSQAAH
jgi:hypothetical protein